MVHRFILLQNLSQAWSAEDEQQAVISNLAQELYDKS